MALDVRNAGATRRHIDLQERLWEARHPSMRAEPRAASARALFMEIRSYLLKAVDLGLLDGGQAGVYEKLKLAPRQDGTLAIAVGDRRNFRRDESLPHFRRTRDRAWFDFQMQIAERDRGIDILAYDFELRLVDRNLVPPDWNPQRDGKGEVVFVRFDLNPEGHGNEEDGLRSHIHVSSDDDGMAIPAPVMSPFELLDVMVHGLTRRGRQRRIDLVTGLSAE